MSKTLLIIGSALNCGSPGHICESLGLLAQENNWDVYMAHGLRYANPSELKTYSVSSHIEEYLHILKSLICDGHGLASKSATRRLIAFIDKIQPTVINIHNLHGYYLNYQILFEYLAKKNIPIVWTLHDFWTITGHCVHFDYIGCNKWQTGCESCQQFRSYPKSLIVDRARYNYQLKKKLFTKLNNVTIVPVSQWVGNLVSKSYLAGYPMQVIYNGINLSVFKPTYSDLREKFGLKDKFVLLGVASPWYPMKGLYDYYQLNNILPDGCKIIMIGLTKQQIAKLPSGIIGIERTESQYELAQYYSMADVTLNLSYQETFGMTTVEGMACGTPAIVYNKTASPELVSEQTGFVVDAGDITGLLNAIMRIKEKGSGLYSEACVNRVRKYYNADNTYLQYIRLFEAYASNQND